MVFFSELIEDLAGGTGATSGFVRQPSWDAFAGFGLGGELDFEFGLEVKLGHRGSLWVILLQGVEVMGCLCEGFRVEGFASAAVDGAFAQRVKWASRVMQEGELGLG